MPSGFNVSIDMKNLLYNFPCVEGVLGARRTVRIVLMKAGFQMLKYGNRTAVSYSVRCLSPPPPRDHILKGRMRQKRSM